MANPTRYFQERRLIRLFFFYSNHGIRKVGFPDSRICPYSNRPNREGIRELGSRKKISVVTGLNQDVTYNDTNIAHQTF